MAEGGRAGYNVGGMTNPAMSYNTSKRTSTRFILFRAKI